MCTGLTLKSENNLHFLGRNLDIPGGFNPNPTVTPRNYEILNTATGEKMRTKYAMLGMAMVLQDIPFYGDVMNEKGLGIVGLSFPMAILNDKIEEGKNNIPEYMFQPWVAGKFATVDELIPELHKLNLMSTPPFKELPPTPMHWIVHDKTGRTVIIENTQKGYNLFEENVGVITNHPDYDWHLENLQNYLNVTSQLMQPQVWNDYKVMPLAPGLGTHGLPGGTASQDRFVRAAWLRHNVPQTPDESSTVTRFFHILQNVAKPKGTSWEGPNEDEYTFYSSCMCLDNGHLYYNCYTNNQISYIDINKSNLDADKLVIYPYADKFEPLAVGSPIN